MPYIYSTLTCDNEYAEWVKQGDQLSIHKTVKVYGGHGVMNKNFITPQGVATEVTDDELAFLMNNSHFKQHMENGFIKVDKKKVEAERVVVDMKQRDGSAQLTPADYGKGGRMNVEAPVVTGGI